MSLKEWKNNEINTKLMKKWGYLNESKLKEGGSGDERYQFDKKEREDELEEGCGYREEDEELEESGAGDWTRPTKAEKEEMEQAEKDDKKSGTTRAAGKEGARGRRNVAASMTIGGVTSEQNTTQKKITVESDGDELEESDAGDWTPPTEDERKEIEQANKGAKVSGKKTKKPLFAKGGGNVAAKIGTRTAYGEGKISVREAKEITRRIIERIKQENK